MFKIDFKILIISLLIVCCKSYAQQLLQIYQVVEIEKYQGKSFTLEGKIFYKNEIGNYSAAVLLGASADEKGKIINKPLYNDGGEFYQKGEWSPYELTGKIDKKAKYLIVGVAIMGNSSYYVDDLKLFVKDGKIKTEIPMKNADFESETFTNWQTDQLDKNTKLTPTSEKTFSGKQSLFIDNTNVKSAPTLGNNPEIGKYMEVNGVKLYYEIYGEGKPLLLIHGNNSDMASFREQFADFSKRYKIIGLDSRGQGKSTSDNTKLTYELMAEDVNTFLDKLELKNVNVLGWSDGGNIAVILAAQHPDKVNKMAIMGTVLFNDNTSVFPEINKLLRDQVKEMENKGVDKSDMNYRLKMLLLTEPNINPDSLQKIQAPTLVMAGQHDVVKEKHTKLIAEKIPKSELVIFKGGDHEAPAKIPQLFNQTVLNFFDKTAK